MRAASVSIPKPAEASTPHKPLPLIPVKPIKRDEPAPSDSSSHRRKLQIVKPEPRPVQESVPERTQPTPQLRRPTPEEVTEDPLVRSVLDVFEGEIKRVHPKRR